MRGQTLVAAGLAIVMAVACSDTTGAGDGRVGISFRLSEAALSAAQNGDLVITGSNGTLTITDISFIVHEFELEATGDACSHDGEDQDDDGDDEGECAEFEAPPAFVSLPFDESGRAAVSQTVPPGTYSSLEFEVENLDDDDEDDDASGLAAIWAAVLAAYPDWPEKASMVVAGFFTPAGGGAATEFTVYFEAEIEIEKELAPPLVVSEGNAVVTVELDPSVWFRRFDGTVMDLSVLDFAATGALVEFEAELENGFQEIDWDD